MKIWRTERMSNRWGMGMPWRHLPRGSVAYSTGLPKYRSRFLANLVGFIPRLLHNLVVKFGPTGLEVDVKDDSLDRWYVTHKKFDPSRNQVRYAILKAFSNQKAQMKFFDLVNQKLEARKRSERGHNARTAVRIL